MTRIEPVPPSVAPSAPRFHVPIPRFSLGRIIKLGLLVGLVWVLVQVARTGLWTIPLISRLVYTVPVPARTVTAQVPTAGDLVSRVPQVITTGNVTITEGELTALAEQGNQKLHLGLASVQTVITQGGIELSFLLPKRNNAVVRLELEPFLDGSGDPDFRVQRTRLGQLTVPSWLIGEPARRLLQLQLQPAFRLLPPAESVTLAEGALAFHFGTP